MGEIKGFPTDREKSKIGGEEEIQAIPTDREKSKIDGEEEI